MSYAVHRPASTEQFVSRPSRTTPAWQGDDLYIERHVDEALLPTFQTGVCAYVQVARQIFTPEEASAAGCKGGKKVRQGRADRAAPGRKGARSRHRALSDIAELLVGGAAVVIPCPSYEVRL